MQASWIVYVLAFTSATLLVLSIHGYFAQERETHEQINRRLAVIETTGDRTEALDRIRKERGIFNDSWATANAFQDWLVQTGLRLDKGRLFMWGAGLTIAVEIVVNSIFGLTPLSFVLGIVSSALLLFMIGHYLRARRISLFQQQLPDVIDIIVRGLKAGHPFVATLSLVSKETPDPAGTEFGIAFDEVSFGLDSTSALKNLGRRVGDPDFLYLIVAVTIHSQSGGNLSEILQRLSYMLRERSKLRLKVAALTAEGRLTALLLTVLPVLIFLVVSFINPRYYGDVMDNETFRYVMYLCGFLLVIGNFVLRRMVNFKY